MDKNYLKGIIEEILYIRGEGIDLDDLSKIIYDASKSEIEACMEEMILEREEKSSGLLIKRYGDSFQFVTRPASKKYLEKILKPVESKLSNSALETLSIIAYKQPITRPEVDKLRGINSQASLEKLKEKGLIEERGRLDKIGKPIIYGTTDYFLRYFNLESLEDLPKLADKKEGDSAGEDK